MFGARVDVLNNRATGPKRFSLKRRRSTDSVERESNDDKEQQKDIELQSDELTGSDKSENDESESDESESESESESDESDESDEKVGDDDSGEKVSDDDSGEKVSDDDSESHEKDGDEDNSDNMNVDDTTTYPTLDTTSSDNYTSKHSRIFSKFQHTLAKQPEDESDEHESEDVDMQDLAPLPQPELPSDRRLRAVNTHSQNLDWLAEPIYAKPANTAPFSSFGLSTFMQQNLTKLGFESAFSVQIEVLKLALKDLEANKLQPDTKGDILVNAATGSGKTLAYLIPIIEALHTRVVPRLRAVVIVPTRPLIAQVFTTMVSLAAGTNLRISTLKLDVSLKEESVKLAENVPDIVITTPGRLVDHLNNKTLDLAVLRYLVIDEADRLLNQSFQNWCEVLHANMTTEVNVAEKWHVAPKKMVFSATLTTDAALLAQLKFIRPRLVVVNEHDELVNELFTIPASLTEYHIRMGDSHLPMKPLILARFLIERSKLANVLVFTKSNEASLRLATILGLLMDKLAPSKVRVAYLNSTNNKKGLRTKILKEFCDREVGILVATDLISRGIDVASITDVVNYDLPHSAREYVHRVGRTARANQHGDAWTITYGYGESRFFHLMGRSIGRGGRMVQEDDFIIRRSILDGDERVYEECLKELERLVKGKDEERR